MRFILTAVSVFLTCAVFSQAYKSNWDAYVMQVNKKPVSVIVDLGLGEKAPLKERPFVVIIRTQLQYPDASGQPGSLELEVLNTMEDKLVESLGRKTGAVYAGRYTQRGLREFYFYSLDTVGYHAAVHSAMSEFGDYKWLSQAKPDRTWTNYFQVLYPPPVEREKIENRRLIDYLKEKGDALKEPRKIDHFFYFKSKIKRDEFMRSGLMDGFRIESMPDENNNKEYPYTLVVSRTDIPDYFLIESLLIPLWEAARKYQGQYDGWETFVVKG